MANDGAAARSALISHLAQRPDAAQAALVFRQSMNFINERGNVIVVATEIRGDLIALELAGPDSQTTLEITVMEAEVAAIYLMGAVRRAKKHRRGR